MGNSNLLGSEQTVRSGAECRDRVTEGLRLALLANLALAQPLFDVTSQNVEFFVAHRASAAVLIGLSIVLSLLIPAALGLVPALMAAIHRRLLPVSRFVLVAGLGSLIVLPLLNRLSFVPDVVKLTLAILLGASFGAAYSRAGMVRAFLTFMSPGILIFPAIFLLFSPVSKLVLEDAGGEYRIQPSSAPKTPLFLLVFDELSTTAILNPELEIDAKLYPNLARLAENAH